MSVLYKFLLCVSCLFFALSATAQDTVLLHPDTLRPADLLQTATDDDILFGLLAEQGKRLAHQQDSIFQQRLLNDTTFISPTTFHIGFRDSILIAKRVQQSGATTPLACPLYYKGQQWKSLTDTTKQPLSVYSIRQEARRYITRQHADLYAGIFDSIAYTAPEAIHAQGQWTLWIPEKSLVKDAEEERLVRLRAMKDQFSLWRKELTTMLQISQNYVSQNWYAGGNSNFALLSIVQGNMLYDNRKNFTWESSLEWRMGFNTVSGDSLRKVNTNDDLFRLYTKIGFKAFGKFSYLLSAEFQTQFFNTWKANQMVLKTGPFTPLRLNMSLGLDYKPVKGLSIVFAPLTYKLIYANDTSYVSSTTFGITSGTKILNDLGSSVRVDWTWKPVREVALDSKFYFYTNYRRVEIDWEIVCNFIINRFLSARLMLHPRYDNTAIPADGQRAKIQFKEMLSIGFAHKFY